MIIDFDEPFDTLTMRDLSFIMFFSQVLDHIQKVFQKVEPIIKILSCRSCNIELWDNFVTV